MRTKAYIVDKAPTHWRALINEYGTPAVAYYIQFEMGELRGMTFEMIKESLEKNLGKPLVARKRRG